MSHGIVSSTLVAGDAQTAALAALIARAQACQRCPRMAGRTRVLGPSNGPPGAAVMFVAEAPGRFGAERTTVPLCGDRSGATFARLLDAAGLDRAEVFVTNAVLCNPQDPGGRNARPTPDELRNCAEHLAAQIAVVDPAWVVALGHTALRALDRLAPHHLRLPDDLGRPVAWRGRRLLYRRLAALVTASADPAARPA
jgi:uracil-DNA glycosylase family 4